MAVEMTGEWIGEYTCGSEYPEGLQPVSFVMTLDASWFGGFRGVVSEDREHGMPGEGRIAGRVLWNRIWFLKLMPIACGVDASGAVKTFAAHWRETSGYDGGDVPHPKIRYGGSYDDATARFCGEWRIERGQGTGTWWMRRKSA